MKSFEQQVKDLLDSFSVPYIDQGNNYDLPDLTVQLSVGQVHIELKEKRQTYRSAKWPLIAPEEHSFIIDEFTVRKMMIQSPNVVLIARDNTSKKYYLADIYSLVFMPRNRFNRRMESIAGDIVHIKGKWCLDFRNFVEYNTLPDVFRSIKEYILHIPTTKENGVDCWHPFPNETLEIAGDLRTLEQRKHDVQATR